MLGASLALIFTCAVHELVHNVSCGSLPQKNAGPWPDIYENWSFLGGEDPYCGLL